MWTYLSATLVHCVIQYLLRLIADNQYQRYREQFSRSSHSIYFGQVHVRSLSIRTRLTCSTRGSQSRERQVPARNGCVGFPGHYTTSAAHHSHHHRCRCRYPHPHRHRPQHNHNYFNYTLSLQAHSAHYTLLHDCK